MKAASQQLIDFLANLSENEPDTAVFIVDLYTFTLTNGLMLNWSSGDRPITLPQGSITGAQVSAGGTGSAVGDTYILNAGNNDAIMEVQAVDGVGAIRQFSLNPLSTTSTNSNGSGYQAWNNVTVYPGGSQPGSGTGILINILSVDGTVTYNVLSPANPDLPSIERSKINSTVGFSVDDLTVTIAATPIVMVGTYSLLAALVIGLFDGANVTVQRLTMPSPGDTSLGTVVWFRGTIGDVADITKIGAKITVKALTEYLNIQMPRNLYQPSCRWTLFDAGCTLKASNFTVAGAVLSNPAPTVISFGTSLTQAGPAAAPTYGATLGSVRVKGVNLAFATYYVVITYVTALGETGPGPEVSLPVGTLGPTFASNNGTPTGFSQSNYLLTVQSQSSAPPGVTGYNVYVGEQAGQWQLQSETPVPIGEVWTENPQGLVQGVPPPNNTTGYFTQGVITFTGGANAGLSRSVTGYTNPNGNGIVTIIDALPNVPAPGDRFTIQPGCSKELSTCDLKFNNLINFGGTPFVPVPETSL